MTAGEWATLTLAEACRPGGLVRGPFGGSLKKSDFVQSGYQVYEQRHAIQGEASRGRYFVSASKFAAMRRFAVEPGDFIVSCSGTIGRIFRIPKNAPKGIINQALLKLTLNYKKIDPLFFRHYFEWDDFQDTILETTQGGAMKNMVGMSVLRNVTLRLPPVPAQRAIGRYLQDADDLIASLERLITKKQAIKQGMMQELLTGRTRLPGFAGSWSKTTLGSLGTFLKGRGIKREDVRSTGTGCIRYGELYTTFNDYTDKTRSFVSARVAATALPLRTGDLLFAGSGETRDEIGKCVAYIGATPVVAGGDVIVLRGDQFNPVYLALLANTPEVVKQKARAGQGDAVVHIYSHALAAVEVDIPSRAEQEAVALLILDVDRELSLLRQRLAKARDIKQGMMQELLTGRTRLPVREAVA